MIARHIRIAAAALLGTAGLVGCATHRLPPVALAPAPIPARPVAPGIVAANYQTPPRDSSGDYVTINDGISPAEAVWQMRAALNVAALGCRGPEESGVIAGYNALLARNKLELAAAYKTVRTQHQARWGRDWENQHDQRMTRVYNFFSQIQAHDAFCAAASDVLAQSQTVAPAALQSFAVTAIPTLEAPFTTFYAAYETYRTQVAAWDAHYGPNADPALRYATAAAVQPAPVTAKTFAPAAAAPKLAYAQMDKVITWERPLVLAANAIRERR